MSIRPITSPLGVAELGSVSSANQSSTVGDARTADASSKASGKSAKVGFRDVDLIDLGIGKADQILKEGVRRADLKDGVYEVGSAALKAGGAILHQADKAFERAERGVEDGLYKLGQASLRVGQASLKAAGKLAHFAGELIAKAAHSFVNAIKTAYANHKAHQVGHSTASTIPLRDRSAKQVAESSSKHSKEVETSFTSAVRSKKTAHLTAEDRQWINSAESRLAKLKDDHKAPSHINDSHARKKNDWGTTLQGHRETDPKLLKEIAEMQARNDALKKP